MIDLKKLETHHDFMGDGWMKARRGMISASCAGKLISKDSHKGIFTQGAITYLRNLAGERVTGKPHKGDFSNSYTDHGNSTEPEAINHFCKVTGFKLLKSGDNHDTHRLIVFDEYCVATPDALVTKYEEKDLFDESGNYLKAETLEVKAPAVSHRFIALYSCNTPADLKKTEPGYYWQTTVQMMFSENLIAHFAVYNRDYPVPMKHIIFEKMKLMEDVKKMNATLHYAKKEIDNIVSLLQVKI